MSKFIPKQYKKEPITLRIDIEKLKEIDAAQYDLSRSAFINQCIDYSIEHMRSDSEK